jgi:hypothetical protein
MATHVHRELSKVWSAAFVVAVVLVLVPYFFLSTEQQSIVFDAVGVAAGAAMVAGILVSRPQPRFAWTLLALGTLTMAGGDVVFGTTQPVPSAADMLYVSAYALLALGLLALVRSEAPSPVESPLTDVLIVAAGVAVAGILFIVVPAEHSRTPGFAARAISVGYPLMDLGLLALCVRSMRREAGRRVVFLLLCAGLVLRLLGDTGYAMLNFGTAYVAGDRADAFWLLSYACFGAALLHPALARSGAWASLHAGEAVPREPAIPTRPQPSVQAQAVHLRTILAWSGVTLLALGGAAMVVAHSWQAPEVVLLAGAYAATGSLVLIASAINA